ncbi:MAG: oligosaccharide flippase family protein [Anaerolineaceae bacterium]|jgi:O-antigen/teichoic acid export membrane protein
MKTNEEPIQDNLTSRSIISVKWNVISNFVSIFIKLTQSIVLARLLPIETFGVVAGAASIIGITGSLSNFGMRGAFNFRCKETEDLESTASVHFTLQLFINIIWTALMLAGGFIFIRETGDGFRTAFVTLTLAESIITMCNTASFILNRLVQHKRLAMISMINVILTLIVSGTLAILKQPLWSLLSSQLVSATVSVIFLYIWRPVWKPKFMFSKSIMKYFLNFGSKQVISSFLQSTLDKVDELWIKIFIGSVPLGYYSKAYSFALYPGSVLASPVNNVAMGTYAEVAHDRKKLSSAFFQTNALLIRSGFLLVGLFFLVAPEFIRIVLGERWLPMLTAFRLMLPYALFDPMKKTMANLFVAVGKPEIIVKIRFIQLITMIAGMFVLGFLFSIEGVAIAVDLMMLVGVVLILHKVKAYVDYSLKSLFLNPFLCMVSGLLIGYGFDQFVSPTLPGFLSAIIEMSIFTLIYCGVFLLLDKQEVLKYIQMIRKYLLRIRNA